jgi:hypothetical protein
METNVRPFGTVSVTVTVPLVAVVKAELPTVTE